MEEIAWKVSHPAARLDYRQQPIYRIKGGIVSEWADASGIYLTKNSQFKLYNLIE